ncbi:MAG: DUF421 domain-containing protein [Deinococcus sp.]|uniref:DUF421 domain-containing protein n=1 Tax=Deinococcus sp. TaxID=47478 RepID=UPI0026DD270F|nr:YetF domain-containing protein [Deinococcus sp.]MDO4246405.1 DUF421 domain-containing protein [Deinococcus sp.]
MDNAFAQTLDGFLGYHLNAGEVQWWQIVLRTAITFAVTLLYVRIGNKRFIAQNTAFDLIVGFMLGSVMSRAVTGSVSLSTALIGGLSLVLLHRLTAALALRSEWWSSLVKGTTSRLVKDGQVDGRAMRASHLSDGDLEEAMRTSGVRSDVSQLESAVLERDGSISVLPKKKEPQILEVKVEDGVQVVRIRLE